MEGTLCVPPEPRTIIGRAIWKPRYVVVGGPMREPPQPPPQSGLAGRLQSSRSSTPKGQLAPPPDAIFLSIYKSKEDYDPIQQHAIGTITDCQVQMVAHRKQGPVLPTLIINIVPDPATDKLRKRRSSRTAGLTATKDAGPTTLWFRNADEHYTLQDWARFIQQLIQPNFPEPSPLSPLTPASPTFINPWAPRSRDTNEVPPLNPRPALYSTGSHQTRSSRERPLTYSESTSLRSKRSDLSSQTGSMYPAHLTFQNYTAMHPADLPSPATTIGEYQGEFIEGWTSAQGRSSTLSSPIRARDSIGSQVPPLQPTIDSSSPPGPRETILDRAFQLRCIPGSETEIPGEEKLSSLARFDALMLEADEKRKEREAEEAKNRAARSPVGSAQPELKSAWDVDDDSDTDGDNDFLDEDDDSDDPVGEMEPDLDDRFRPSPRSEMSHPAYAGRRPSTSTSEANDQPHRAQSQRSPLSYQHNTQESLSIYSAAYQPRPQTGYSNSRRPSLAQRMHSQPQLVHGMSPPTNPPPVPYLQPSSALLSGRTASGKPSEDVIQGVEPSSSGAGSRKSGEKRLSISSTKRLSFTEFTKRLSSTSSLLLVQTNASGGSSRGSNSDFDAAQQQSPQPSQPHYHLNPRAPPPLPLGQPQYHQQGPHSPQLPNRDKEDDKRCGWRGSVGVFGAEGGFL